MTVWDVFWRYGWMWALLANGLIVWLSWSLSRRFVTHPYFSAYSKGIDERFKQLEQRQADTEMLLKSIATSLAALPTAGDLHRLEVSLTAIDGSVKASQAEVRGLANAVARIERVVDMLTETHIGDK